MPRQVYQRLPRPTPSDAVRFWAKVDFSAGPESCWLWIGTKRNGYGAFSIGGREGNIYYAHRLTYEWFVGAIPPGFDVDHICRNQACVNYLHLEAVSHAENIRRGLRGRLITHCPQGHAYTPENTYLNGGRRVCRTCWTKRGAVA